MTNHFTLMGEKVIVDLFIETVIFAALWASGAAAVIASAVLHLTHFRKKALIMIMAVVGTVMTFPLCWLFGLNLLLRSDIDDVAAGIATLIPTILMIFYDIFITVKYIMQKKNKPMEEQQNG